MHVLFIKWEWSHFAFFIWLKYLLPFVKIYKKVLSVPRIDLDEAHNYDFTISIFCLFTIFNKHKIFIVKMIGCILLIIENRTYQIQCIFIYRNLLPLIINIIFKNMDFFIVIYSYLQFGQIFQNKQWA